MVARFRPARAANLVAHRELAGSSHEYTCGKSSSFRSGFAKIFSSCDQDAALTVDPPHLLVRGEREVGGGGDLDGYPLSVALHSAARSCGVTLGHAARFVRRKHRPGSGGITYKHRLQDKVLSAHSEVATEAPYLSSSCLQGVWYSCKAEGGKTHMNASEPELVKSFVDVDALSTWLVCNCELTKPTSQPNSHCRPKNSISYRLIMMWI